MTELERPVVLIGALAVDVSAASVVPGSGPLACERCGRACLVSPEGLQLHAAGEFDAVVCTRCAIADSNISQTMAPGHQLMLRAWHARHEPDTTP